MKVTRSDFLADFKKEEKHELLKKGKQTCFTRRFSEWGGTYTRNYGYMPDLGGKRGEYVDKVETCLIYFVNPQQKTPNRFYYCVPKGLISLDELPPYAGLIEIEDHGHYLEPKYSKQAPMIHHNKVDHTKQLLTKFFHQHLNMKRKGLNK